MFGQQWEQQDQEQAEGPGDPAPPPQGPGSGGQPVPPPQGPGSGGQEHQHQGQTRAGATGEVADSMNGSLCMEGTVGMFGILIQTSTRLDT
jgi:hypothetical protein